MIRLETWSGLVLHYTDVKSIELVDDGPSEEELEMFTWREVRNNV